MTASPRPPEPGRYIGADDWQILRLLCGYRLLLAAVLLGIFYTGVAPRLLGDDYPRLFQLTCYAYALAGIVLGAAVIYRTPPLVWQAALQFAADAAAVTALIFACGGVSSGLGMLLITPAVGASLVVPRRIALALASAGALALLGEEGYRQFQHELSASAIAQAGFLGAIFIVTAWAANAVAVRARRSEAQVARVGSELVNLARLNEIIVETLQTGVVVVDAARRIRMLNDAAKRLLQTQPGAVGHWLHDEAPGLDRLVRDWKAGDDAPLAPMLPNDDAAEVIPRFSNLGWGAQAPTLILLEDAARLREQAQQMKLASLGRLSASIAHEIRNPLSAISHSGQLLAESAGLSEEDRRLLGMIHRHSERIDKIVKDVLALSRRDPAVSTRLELPSWLAGAVQQYQEGKTGRIVHVDAGDEPVRVRFDPHHLQQVLFNLWDNAFEHCGPAADLHVSVSAGRLTADGPPVLDVVDNGPGVPVNLLEQVFEPFFTTAHQGTGLGLYLARELCEYNQARLIYITPPDGGACFRLLLTEAPPDS